MVNLLQYQLIDTVMGIPVRTSHRVMVAFSEWLTKYELKDGKLPVNVLNDFYILDTHTIHTEKDIKVLTNGLFWFFNGGEIPEETEKKEKPTAIAFDFETDSDAVLADFAHYYGIRLAIVDMHWFEFKKLLQNLPAKSQTKQRMYYRTVDVSEIKNKKEKENILKMRSLYAIKKDKKIRTIEQADAKLMSYADRRYQELLAYQLEKEMNSTDSNI